MVVIFYPKAKKASEEAFEKAFEKPADWAFMEASEQILANKPNTWKAYPDTEAGMVGIIDMEYEEFKKAKTVAELKQELEHLASACLHFWRHLSNVRS